MPDDPIAKDIREIRADVGKLVANYDTLAPKAYVDDQFNKLRQEIAAYRSDTASRADVLAVQTGVNNLHILMVERFGKVPDRGDVIPRSETEARINEIKSSVVAVTAKVDAMTTNASNRVWDILKTMLPWAVAGAALTALISYGHLTLH